MKVEATVKVLNEVKTGTNRNTGDEYKYQTMIIEFPDGNENARVMASLGPNEVESAQSLGIKRGSRVIVDLSFTTQVSITKYVDNRVYVRNIALVSNLPQVQVPAV